MVEGVRVTLSPSFCFERYMVEIDSDRDILLFPVDVHRAVAWYKRFVSALIALCCIV